MNKIIFEIPTGISTKSQESPILSTLREGEPITAVCRVIPLINQYGSVKGFILKSVIGEVGKNKKQQKEEIKETLDSFVDEDEQI